MNSPPNKKMSDSGGRYANIVSVIPEAIKEEEQSRIDLFKSQQANRLAA